MKRFTPSAAFAAIAAIAIGLSPVAGTTTALAYQPSTFERMYDESTDGGDRSGDSSGHVDVPTYTGDIDEVPFSFDDLRLTDYALNPTDGNLRDIVRTIRSHPCFRARGLERERCEERQGFPAGLDVATSDFEFAAWLNGEIADVVCADDAAVAWVTCTDELPVVTSTNIAAARAAVDADAMVYSDAYSHLMNEQLFARAGTPLTTREHAIRILVAGESDDEPTPQERSQRLWDACDASTRGQIWCYQSFIRFIGDTSVDIDALDDIVWIRS